MKRKGIGKKKNTRPLVMGPGKEQGKEFKKKIWDEYTEHSSHFGEKKEQRKDA